MDGDDREAEQVSEGALYEHDSRRGAGEKSDFNEFISRVSE